MNVPCIVEHNHLSWLCEEPGLGDTAFIKHFPVKVKKGCKENILGKINFVYQSVFHFAAPFTN